MVTKPVDFSNGAMRQDSPDDFIHWGLFLPPNACGLGQDKLREALHLDPAGLALGITVD